MCLDTSVCIYNAVTCEFVREAELLWTQKQSY